MTARALYALTLVEAADRPHLDYTGELLALRAKVRRLGSITGRKMDTICLSCDTPLDEAKVVEGVVHCPTCNDKFIHEGEALTYIDDFPVDEYLGG